MFSLRYSGLSSAELSPTRVPLHTWCHGAHKGLKDKDDMDPVPEELTA